LLGTDRRLAFLLDLGSAASLGTCLRESFTSTHVFRDFAQNTFKQFLRRRPLTETHPIPSPLIVWPQATSMLDLLAQASEHVFSGAETGLQLPDTLPVRRNGRHLVRNLTVNLLRQMRTELVHLHRLRLKPTSK